ncbi:hypothetical protein SUDANB171_04043 [Streptomyces sp. enrichment culture]|jgi:hypothetical protein|uniref:toll/interleukin-1 receptor domain-containing protein n=1 Tax=Streptomyces xiamenensis TaxID=408015 RepID=UPI0037D746CC
MPASPEIFVNYRTGDGEMAAAMIRQELARRFGDDRVFFDNQSIDSGENYTHRLPDAIRRCQVLIAVIGRAWAGFRGADGGRALENPHDWTRREIVEAHEYGIPVIPVLIGKNTPWPKRSEVPQELAFVTEHQYVTFDHRSAPADLHRIGEELIKTVPELAEHDADQADETDTKGPDDKITTSQTMGDNSGTAYQMNNLPGNVRIGDTGATYNGDVGALFTQPNGVVNTGNGPQHVTQFSGDVRDARQQFFRSEPSDTDDAR